MELTEYLRALRASWWVLQIGWLLGFAGGYAYSQTVEPAYRASAGVFVSVPSAETVGERVQGAAYAQGRIESYAELATKPYVLDPVIDALGLDTTARALGGSVDASPTIDTSILEIEASAGSPGRAAAVADAVAQQLAVAVAELEGAAPGQPQVRLTVVENATPPAFAYQPNTRLAVATGTVVGLALGVLAAVLRALLDTRVRGLAHVRRVTATPVLGSVRRDRRAMRERVVMRTRPSGDQAEAYRRVRTNLRFVGADRARSILVTSAVAGEGKTSTVVNLAVALAENGAHVLLVDADLRRPSVAACLGLEGAAGLTNVLIGDVAVDEVVQPGDGIDVLASGPVPPNPSELLDSPAMAALLTELTLRYDVVLLDSPPVVPVTDAAVLARLVEGTVLVVGCSTVRRGPLAEALASLGTVGATVLGLVLNAVPARSAGATYAYGATRRTGRGWRTRRSAGRHDAHLRAPADDPGPEPAASRAPEREPEQDPAASQVPEPEPAAEPGPGLPARPQREAGTGPPDDVDATGDVSPVSGRGRG